MSNTYVKLFGRILDSSIWLEDTATRIVWITLLAMANEDGIVSAPVPVLANRARVTFEECEAALSKFQAPDKWSHSQEYEGRRIEARGNDWLILNHGKYRDEMSAEARREYKRVKAAQYRAEARALNQGKVAREMVRERVRANRVIDGEVM